MPVQQGFKYEAMWLRAAHYKDTLEKAWAAGRNDSLSLQSTWINLNRVASCLRTWSKESFGCILKQINKMERRLRTIRSSPISADSLAEERKIEGLLFDLFEREEILERQRSRVDWLREGDRNTKFFHARAAARRRANKISSLLRDDGSSCDSQGEIKGMVLEFYDKLFTSEPCDMIDVVLDSIPRKVSSEMNSDL